VPLLVRTIHSVALLVLESPKTFRKILTGHEPNQNDTQVTSLPYSSFNFC
jgi:hypothetical protein